jgi:hypothetical protein
LNLLARNQKKENNKNKNTNHHSLEDLGEDQPPPVLSEGTKLYSSKG